MLSAGAELSVAHPRSHDDNGTSVLTMPPFWNRPLPERVAVFHAHELGAEEGLEGSIE